MLRQRRSRGPSGRHAHPQRRLTSRDTWTLPPDPITQTNRYLYANGAPLTGRDPDGHMAVMDDAEGKLIADPDGPTAQYVPKPPPRLTSNKPTYPCADNSACGEIPTISLIGHIPTTSDHHLRRSTRPQIK